MRFVAGCGVVAELLACWCAVAELLAGSAMAKRMTGLWHRTIGKRKIVKSRSAIMKIRRNSAELDNSCADGDVVVF